MKVICSIILILLLIQSVKGQELYGKYLNHEQGLLSEECYDINYDENGYLIVSTPYGPMKYDGQKFISICTNLPMEKRVIYDFEKSPDGTIYMVNSKSELFKLEKDRAIWIGPKNLSEFLKKNRGVIKLYYSEDGLYLSTYSQYVKYSFKTQKVEPFHQQDSTFNFTYNSKAPFPFTKTFRRKTAIFTVKIDFPEYKQQFTFKNSIVADSREHQITTGKTSFFLVCMNLFKKTGNRIIPMDFRNVLFLNYFHDRLWLCTFDGLIELDSEGNFIHHHFKGETIGGVVPLEPKGIAVSLNQKGIFISSDLDNRIHYDFTPSASAKIRGMNLVGNSKGELFRYKDYKLEKVAGVPPLQSDIQRNLHHGICGISMYKNYLQVYTGQGISLFTPSFKNIKKNQNAHLAVFETFNYKEDVYLIERTGMIKINWNKLITPPFKYYNYLTIPLKEVRCHALLNDSTMLFGSNEGLIKYHLNTNRYSFIDLFKKELRIVGIHVFNKNKFLVCTRFDGIYVIYKNRIVRKIQSPCISVSSILFYNNHLILRGNDAIYSKSFNQTENSPWFKLFSGEAEKMFLLDNNLLIADKKDMIIRVLSDKRSVFKPKIVLSKFLQGDMEMTRFPKTIPPNKSISVDVDILQFDANKLGLYYQLKGQNTISQQIEGTKINFDALKSGSYSLEIYPVIDGKIQFNNSKTFHFTIEKTFWESTVFYIVAGVLVISVIISILLLINLRRKRRSAERAELESKLNEYKLLAVKAQVNPHFLSNGLAAIQALILKGDNDLAAHYLAKFSFLMRKILYYSETQFITLKQELELVDAYLELELLRFRNRFFIQKKIDLSEKQLHEIQFPSLLLQPILENAIWHGLKFQENNPELHMAFHLNEKKELVAQLSDNGHGFTASNKSEEHLSKGNQLITERIDALNEQFQKPVASMEVSSSGSGTTVTFIFSPELYHPS